MAINLHEQSRTKDLRGLSRQQVSQYKTDAKSIKEGASRRIPDAYDTTIAAASHQKPDTKNRNV